MSAKFLLCFVAVMKLVINELNKESCRKKATKMFLITVFSSRKSSSIFNLNWNIRSSFLTFQIKFFRFLIEREKSIFRSHFFSHVIEPNICSVNQHLLWAINCLLIHHHQHHPLTPQQPERDYEWRWDVRWSVQFVFCRPPRYKFYFQKQNSRKLN